MTMQWILGWWNLVFLVPFSLALLYLAAYTVSGVTFGDADADAATDAEADVDAHDLGAEVEADGAAGADAHTDVDAHADVDADAEVHADAEAGVHAGANGHHGQHHPHHPPQPAPARVGFGDALAWIGMGRMPLSLVLMILLLAWGFIGFVANQFLREAMPHWMIPLISLPLAAVGSVLATRVATRSLTRWMPIDETYARRRGALLGEVGEAMFAIDERFGMAAVRDDRGNLFQVSCRVEPGRATIPKGAKVLLVSHDAKRNFFHVTPDDGGVLARDPQAREPQAHGDDATAGRRVTERGLLP